ncbi:hypothetical protein JCM8202_005572 [Rhodotorula sphaerocarpa]
MAKSAKGGYYAVRVGRKPGVYRTWDECAAQVNGFQGARHKKFPTEAEARAFVGGDGGGAVGGSSTRAAASRTQKGGEKGTGAVTQALKAKRTSDAADLPQSSAKRAMRTVVGATGTHAEKKGSRSAVRRVFCDGSSRGNGQKGAVAGIGIFWSHEEGAPNISERLPGKLQTNNRAEMYAVARILETDPHPEEPLTVCSDSEYTIGVFSKWIPGWRNRGWRTSDGKPVANQDLIRYILSLLALRMRPDSQTPLANITFQKVKAHVGIEGNEQADRFANNGAMMPEVEDRDFAQATKENERKLKERSAGPVKSVEEVEWAVEIDEGDLLDEDELQRLEATQRFD